MMEITIKINGRMMSVEVNDEVAECYDQGKRKAENLSHEKRRHWDEREFDEYIVATEGLLSILDTCTAIQRERFLLYALYDYTYDEIGLLYGCSKYAIRDSIEAVRKKFQNFFLD